MPLWLPPSRGEAFGIFFVLVVLVGLIYVLLHPDFSASPRSPGLGWKCADIPNSEAVCVRDVTRKPSDAAP